MKRWSHADLMMMYVVVVWGSLFSVVKVVAEEVPIGAANAVRFLAIIPAFLLILVLRGDYRMPRRDWLLVTLLGAFGFGAYQVLSSLGISLTVVAGSALILASTPIFATLFSGVFRVERITAAGWLGVAVGFAGISVIVLGEHGLAVFDIESAFGELVLVASAACWAGGAVLSKPLMGRHSSMKITAYSSVIGSLMMLPLTLPDLATVDFGAVGWPALALLLYWILAGNIVGQLVRFAAVKQIGPHKATIYIYLVPFSAALIGALAIGSPVGVHHLVGGAVIFAGVGLTRLSPGGVRRRTPRLAP